MAEPAFSMVVDGYDDEEDIPCDPGPDRARELAGHIHCFLLQACRNELPAWCLGIAMLSLAHRHRDERTRGTELHHRDRDMLLQTITRLKALIPGFIPEYPADQFRIGLDAFAMRVILWSETAEERAARHPDEARDSHDYAKMLRQDMRNWCLRDRIRERAHARRAATVASLLDESLPKLFG